MITNSSERKFNLRMLLVLAFGHFATDIFQSALPTILPLLKAKLLLSYTASGIILLASNITSSVIQPIFGYLTDKRERTFLLPAGCLCAGLGLSLLALANHYGLALLLVAVSGLGIASYHPEGFKTARFFTGDKPATGLAVFTVGGNLGLAAGPLAVAFVTTYFGFDYLPLMLVFPAMFMILFALSCPTTAASQTSVATASVVKPPPSKEAYVPLGITILAVIARSWTHFGIMAYIPFYYIDFEKGDPLYAGTLVSVFLLGGAVGTLLGSPLADRWGYKRYLLFSFALTAALFPLIFVVHGVLLFIALGVVGTALISSFTVTMVIAQELLPNNMGIASGLMAGFAIGTGGIGVTLLGLIADNFSVPTALKCIIILPILGFILTCFIKYPLHRSTIKH